MAFVADRSACLAGVDLGLHVSSSAAGRWAWTDQREGTYNGREAVSYASNWRNIMASTKRRYSKEEFARRGDEIYETQVRPHLKPEDEGKFAAIDIESQTYVIAGDELEACDKLNTRIPEAQIWLVRIGSRYLHRFGGREKRGMA
jgi:hypothetical protein